MKTTNGNRTPSIDLFRYFCAILVVAIHTRPLEEINAPLGFVFSDIITRIGVPFFFSVSGYYYYKKYNSQKYPFFRYFERLLIIYSLWSCFYYLIDFLQWGHSNIKGFFINCIFSYFIYGSYYHFWYFPALIISICLSSILLKTAGKKEILTLSLFLYAIGCLGCAYYNVCKGLPLMGALISNPRFIIFRRVFLMGFPFFTSGALVQAIKEKVDRRQAVLMWWVSFIIWVLEIWIVVRLQLQNSLVLTFGLFMLAVSTLVLLLKHPMQKCIKGAVLCKYLADYTYYVHPAFILIITVVYQALFRRTVPNTLLFFMTVIITFMTGFLVYFGKDNLMKRNLPGSV